MIDVSAFDIESLNDSYQYQGYTNRRTGRFIEGKDLERFKAIELAARVVLDACHIQFLDNPMEDTPWGKAIKNLQEALRSVSKKS